MPFDFFILPLYRAQGQIGKALPGVALFSPPRRAVRGRMEEQLLCYLALLGHPVAEAETQRLLQEIQATYYVTPGSTTSALRAAALRLNQLLLERNFALRSQRRYNLGLLLLLAIQPEQIIFLQGGPAHLLLWEQKALRHFYDPEGAGQGLGHAQTPHLRYGQITLQAAQRLLLCGKLPSTWENLSLDPSSLPALYRHLMVVERGDVHALLIGIEAGRGAVTWLPIPSLSATSAAPTADQAGLSASSPISGSATAEALYPAHYIGDPAKTATAIAGMTTSQPTSSPQKGEEGINLPATSESPSSTSSVAQAVSQDAEKSQPPETSGSSSLQTPEPASPVDGAPSAYALPRTAAVPGETVARPRVEKESVQPEASPAALPRESTQASAGRQLLSSPKLKSIVRYFLSLLEAYRQRRQQGLEGIARFSARLLPQGDTTLPLGTQWLLLFLAIAIPLLVVTAATVTYLRYGRDAAYQSYLAQAQNLRAQALTLQDAVAQRDAWQGVLFYLSKAEAHRDTEQTRALRQEAEMALDRLFGIVHLDFQPALSYPLPAPVTRMVFSQGDLYLLDAQNGRVLHVASSERGLRLDESFQCGPGEYEGVTVGAIVDLWPLPDFNLHQAKVLAADAAGRLLYCTPNSPPYAIPLPRPNATWSRLTAFALDGETLYVLDAPSRAIWEYPGYQSAFERPPRFIFQQQVPPLENAIDLIAYQDTLYILHANGVLTICTNSRLESVPTRCTSPAILRDPYPAHQGLAEFQQLHFTQLNASILPGMPLLFLDDEHQAIYRFSSRSLELQNIWKANPRSLSGLRWTAFTLSSDNILYLVLENRLYFAPLP